jgi:hypothetical protein
MFGEEPCCGCFPDPAVIEPQQIVQRPAQRSVLEPLDEEEEPNFALSRRTV